MNKYSLVILTFITMIVISSCSKDFLERDPNGVLTEDQYVISPDAALKLVTSSYQPMLDGWGYTVNKIAVGEEVVDNANGGGSDPGDRPQTFEVGTGRPLPSNALLFETWNNRYRGIGKCNVALDAFERNGERFVENGLSEEELARFISEVKFLRAWYYFDLITVFKEVPLVLTVESPDTRKEKATIQQLRDQLYKDLDDAINEQAFPRLQAIPVATEKGRATKDAAYGLKARAALFFAGIMEQGRMEGDAMAEYSIAVNASQEIIENGNLNLLPDFQDLYRGDYTVGPFSTEVIFGVLRNYDPAFGLGGDAAAIMNVGRNNVGGYGGNTPTKDLAAAYNPADPRKMFTIISHNDIFPTSSGGEEVHNYRGYYNEFSLQHSRKAFVPQQYRQQNNLLMSNWQPYWMRYSEILLIYAESLFKTGGSTAEVLESVNQVRRRAFVTTSKTDEAAIYRLFEEGLLDIDDATFEANYAIKASDDIYEAIKKERRLELALEGLRLYDLIRWGDYASTMKAYYEEYGFADQGVNAGENSWPFPIPQIEIDRSNGALVQHPNY
ncbi:RagB/SusD family nutrient uptake outer membrane protein [Antarcticibacterium sp. 1MA-6-2]|uniref:RagB/SusD family nutrient uptake outer membrane protein n=1 Tax=Antarcticibacterium sp. 1MA-6-2 TaxID=2908210 RepID=UPI001F300E66|nr:RagB/SusD family nutrient uptake outer membrane protein [Antarcticibacterium sp. 1MA-6-2]UJH90103.1 RagB/SusD family nutrient uptake outer membrane protein [Antarcticibacterium sp. 1MA-6-2]